MIDALWARQHRVEAMAEFQSALEEQAQQRLDEQNIRLQMAADFASKIQTLQN